jgi:Zn-dependent protease
LFFGKRFALFEILGIKVQVDPSWIVIALLLTWSLATGLFPQFSAEFNQTTLWTMAIVAMIGFFASLIAHEFSHALVARRDGLEIRAITLFIFGGVAEMEDEPANARAEFRMAIAGPIASVALGVAFYTIAMASAFFGLPQPFTSVLYYLAAVNIILAIFNMAPAFPLDGGRVLRAVLWRWRDDLRWATRIASNLGNLFGLGLIFLGIFLVVTGNTLPGIWWVLIGFFVRSAAISSYMHVLATRALEGMPIHRFMTGAPVTVPSNIPVSELVETYIYGHRHEFFPVTAGDRLVGLVSIANIKKVAKSNWPTTLVSEIATPVSPENSVGPNTDATRVLALMRRTGNTRLLVIENGRLVGVVTLKDLLAFFGLKLDLEETA